MADPASVLVAMATYNEMESLPQLVEQVFRYLPEAHVLVIDDNSPDGTGQWCDRKAKEDRRLHCVHREAKQGLGTALVAAMKYALDHGYAYLVTMDADLSHPPDRLPDLLAAMGPAHHGADVAIGSRYLPGGVIKGWPWTRHLASRAVNLLARYLLGLPTRDSSSGFRCYRVDLLARIEWTAIRSFGYSFEEEMLWRLKRVGARFREIPIRFVNRRKGASKVNLREMATSALVLLRLGVQNLLGR